jgi:hypothetical protein
MELSAVFHKAPPTALPPFGGHAQPKWASASDRLILTPFSIRDIFFFELALFFGRFWEPLLVKGSKVHYKVEERD